MARRHLLPGILILAIFPLALGLGACGDDDEGGTEPTIRHPQDFLPQDIEGWLIAEGSLQTAATIDELRATRINGGYEPYQLHDFQEFAGCIYSGALGELEVRIFELRTAADAVALHEEDHEEIAKPTATPLEGLGDAARTWGTAARGLDFVRDQYWSRLTITDGSEDAALLLEAFAQSIDQRMTP